MLNTTTTHTTYEQSAPVSDIQLAKSLATTLAKAKTLFRDGYTAKPTRLPFFYVVTSPEGAVYDVDVKGQTCTCAMFARGGTCKHLIATRYRFIQAIAFLAPIRENAPHFSADEVAPDPRSWAATLRYEFWGESHDTPRVWRLVPTDRPGSAGRIFRSESEAREWAAAVNVLIVDAATETMEAWK